MKTMKTYGHHPGIEREREREKKKREREREKKKEMAVLGDQSSVSSTNMGGRVAARI